MIADTAQALAEKLVTSCRAKGLSVTTAESCTGGLVAAAITSVAGSSEMFSQGFITYSNAAKTALLGVPAGLLAAVGAVSEAVAARMAEGARLRAGADFAVSVTGVAGPGGGSLDKPVGTVFFGLSAGGSRLVRHRRFAGDRAAIRAASVEFVLNLLLGEIGA